MSETKHSKQVQAQQVQALQVQAQQVQTQQIQATGQQGITLTTKPMPTQYQTFAFRQLLGRSGGKC